MITPDLAGCWLDGAMGWHNTYRVIYRAQEWGFRISREDSTAVRLYASGDVEKTAKLYTRTEQPEVISYDRAAEWVQEISSDATEHLQERAPEGYVFTWDAGELLLLAESECE
jgi:hypothetical protein